jgi:hypothetical protein
MTHGRGLKMTDSRRIAACIAALALLASPACNRAPKPAPPAAEPVDAGAKLRQMSETLARASHLTFRATRQLDAGLVEGSAAPELTEIEVAVSRPAMVRARSASPTGVRRFYADGKSMSLLDETMNLYATVPAIGSIDEVVERIDRDYGFTPPLAEFVLNDAYQKLSGQLTSTAYKGIETVNGIECDRLALGGEVADADVWVSRDTQLPQRFVATFKDREGAPHLTINFSEWNLAATLDDASFAFTPPKGADRITMDSTGDLGIAPTKASK